MICHVSTVKFLLEDWLIQPATVLLEIICKRTNLNYCPNSIVTLTNS